MPPGLTLGRKARTMRWLSLAAAAATPLAYAALWTRPAWARSLLLEALPGIAAEGVGFTQLVAGFWLGLVPVALLSGALVQAARFFHLYQADDLFPAASAPLLRALGKLLLAAALAGVVVRTLSGLLFTAHLPAGQKQLIISLSSSDVFLVIFGALMLMIGHILAEASRIAAEHRQFV